MVATFRSSSSANGGSGTAASFTPTLPTGWAAGDIIFVIVNVGSTGATFDNITGWPNIHSDANSGGAGHTTGVYYRVMQAGDAAPTLTVGGGGGGSKGKWAWSAIAIQPGAGEIIAVDADPGAVVNTTTSTTLSPGSAASANTVCSVILFGDRATTNSATAIAVTAPTSWTKDGTGPAESSTAVGTTAATRQVQAASVYRNGQTGTVTPGTASANVTVCANSYHFLVSSATPVDVSGTLAAEAAGTGAAQDITGDVDAGITEATGSGVANDLTVNYDANPDLDTPTGMGEAQDLTATIDVSSELGNAAGTGIAEDLTANLDTAASITEASGTATAQDLTITYDANPALGTAAGTATALDLSGQIAGDTSASVSTANATATALDLGTALDAGPTWSTAGATGMALGPGSDVEASLGAASASGTAAGPTGGAAGDTSATLASALATCAAVGLSADAECSSGTAMGTGGAPDFGADVACSIAPAVGVGVAGDVSIAGDVSADLIFAAAVGVGLRLGMTGGQYPPRVLRGEVRLVRGVFAVTRG